MKIKFYIITYNNNQILNDWILKSLYESDYDRNNVQIFIINNHSNIKINDEYQSFIKVLNNDLRPDFSTGHLSRNHNQAIINGFKDLDEPDCDVVISCQNDTFLLKNWYTSIIEVMDKYTYFTCGSGDQFQSWRPNGIKNIGLYDERFCNIGFQEADYFLRAYLYNRDFSSINDIHHGRLFNMYKEFPIIVDHKYPIGAFRNDPHHKKSERFHLLTHSLFFHKWGDDIKPAYWRENDTLSKVIECKILNYVFYPYFETKILNLKEKNYFSHALH